MKTLRSEGVYPKWVTLLRMSGLDSLSPSLYRHREVHQMLQMNKNRSWTDEDDVIADPFNTVLLKIDLEV